MLYDGIDWQLPEAYRPVIRCIGQNFFINVIVHKKPGAYNENQIFMGLIAPSPISGNSEKLLTWHKLDKSYIATEDKV